jgi:hypothetical protein
VSAVDDAWQRALAAEHRAVFGYGVLGPHLNQPSDVQLAHASQAAHELLRDQTEAELTAAAQLPTPPLADYPDLYPVAGASAAQQLAISLEQDAAAAWRFLYAATVDAGAASSALRATAQAALTASAVRATRWRMAAGLAAATVAFPGV